VILYADSMTMSMQKALDETNRRRERQLKYNAEHGITPETIKKAIRRGIEDEISARKIERDATGAGSEAQYITQEYLAELEKEMLAAAEALEFERAAAIRDKLTDLQRKMSSDGEMTRAGDIDRPGFATSSRGDRERGRGRKGKGRGAKSRGRVPRPKSRGE
jgi:excinuclease ABC subunit B